MEFTIISPTGCELLIPAKYEVCDTCNGKGSYVNPSIDSNGLSSEDLYDDPDFAEDYFSGKYDVSCNECKGARVSPTVDWESLSSDPKLTQIVQDYIDEYFAYQREVANERRYGY